MEQRIKLKRVELIATGCRKTLAQVQIAEQAPFVTNCGFFEGTRPVCHLKIHGNVLTPNTKETYWGYAWNDGELPTLESIPSPKDNYIAAVCMVKDGKPHKMYYNKDVGGSRPRTAFGRFPDGTFWWFCSKTPHTPETLQAYALKQGVIDAIMLDGGGSTQGYFNREWVTSDRMVHNWLCGFTSDCPFPEPIGNHPRLWNKQEICWLQWHLKNKGLYKGGTDGKFGPMTIKGLINLIKEEK